MPGISGIRQGELTRAGLDRWHEERPAVAVGVPMMPTVWRTAFWPFMFMVKRLRPDDHLLPINRSAVPGEARNKIIEAFLQLPDSVEYLFLFDDDMVVNQDVIDFLSWTQAPFMSAYCSWKQAPYAPTAAMYVGEMVYQGKTVPRYAPVTNWRPNSGLHVCDGVGAAALCLRRDLLVAIGNPWFEHGYGGEDYTFCRKVQALGHHIVVNTNCEIGHIGEFIAKPSDFFTQPPSAETADYLPDALPTPEWVPQLEVVR